jgi:hypothetical protein
MKKEKDVEYLHSWKKLLDQIKKVDRAIGCVVEGMKGFGLGQKPKFVTNRKKGFWVRAGSGRLVFKPNAKRDNYVGSSKGLGPVAGFADMVPSLLTGSDAGLGPSMGSDLGRSYPNPFVSPEVSSSAVKDGVF